MKEFSITPTKDDEDRECFEWRCDGMGGYTRTIADAVNNASIVGKRYEVYFPRDHDKKTIGEWIASHAFGAVAWIPELNCLSVRP